MRCQRIPSSVTVVVQAFLGPPSRKTRRRQACQVQWRLMPMLPLFVSLAGRDVLLVGGGKVAASKLQTLLDAGAQVRVVASEVCDEIAAAPLVIAQRPFVPADVDGAWLVVA